MHTYRISPAGRRVLLAYIVGALIVWAMAFWALRDTLAPLGTGGLGALASMGASQIIPALLMLGAVVAVPVVLWGTLAEHEASFTPAEDGLRYQTLGIALTFAWADMAALSRSPEGDAIVLRRDPAAGLANPALRLLHRLAWGGGRVVIPQGLDDREQLLATIREAIDRAD